jgi:hypothetical protein
MVNFSISQEKVDKKQAWIITKDEVLSGCIKNKNIYISNQPLKSGEEIASWSHIYSVPEEFKSAWFVFIDDAPDANWEHPCRYVFIDEITGSYKIVEAKSPPDDLEKMIKIYPKKKNCD